MFFTTCSFLRGYEINKGYVSLFPSKTTTMYAYCLLYKVMNKTKVYNSVYVLIIDTTYSHHNWCVRRVSKRDDHPRGDA